MYDMLQIIKLLQYTTVFVAFIYGYPVWCLLHTFQIITGKNNTLNNESVGGRNW